MSMLGNAEMKRLKEEMISSGFEYRNFDLNKVNLFHLHSVFKEDYVKESSLRKNFILNYDMYRKRIRFEINQGMFVFYPVEF